jgi:hypothetical protein
MSSIFEVDTDQVITRQIVKLCRKLENTHPSSAEFITIVNAIAQLRASLNTPIIESK